MTESHNTPAPDPSTGATPVPPSADAASGGATPTEEGATGSADPTAAAPVSGSGTSGGAGGAGGTDAPPTTGALPPVDPDATLESPGAPPAGTAAWGTADGPAVPLPGAAAAGATDTSAAAAPDAASAGSTGASTAPVDAAVTGGPPSDASTAPMDTGSAGAMDASAASADAASDTSALSTGTAPADASGAAAGAAPTIDGPGHGHMPRTLPADPPGGALTSDRINLVAESGQAMSVGVRTPLGKHMVRQFGEDSNAWDTEQCTIERGPEGAWQIVPAAGTTNETLLNGEPITSAQPLHDGDVIAVGRAAKGVVKLPLTARAG